MCIRDRVDALNAGKLDIGLTRLPKDLDAFNYSKVISEPYFLAVNKQHELSKKENITVSELNNEFSKIPELSTTVIFLVLSLLVFDKNERNKPKPTNKNGINKVISKNFLFFT